MKTFKTLLFIGILALTIWLVDEFTPYDETDNKPLKIRSGLSVHTDYGTGCQYLSRGYFSGLIPRMDGAGDHVGCKK